MGALFNGKVLQHIFCVPFTNKDCAIRPHYSLFGVRFDFLTAELKKNSALLGCYAKIYRSFKEP
jgi:hypothetical protein